MSQTVVRAIDILRFISATGRTLSEVATHLGVHKSTALRLLQTLGKEGFSRQLPNGAYVTGFGVIALGQRAIDQIDTRAIAHPYLARLSQESGHTVHLAQLVALCRCRHKSTYADSAIMPMSTGSGWNLPFVL